MNLTEQQKTDIISKHEKLESIKPILKKEYIGIDDAIDNIVDAIRPFYIFPETLKRPLIVNLWGMTGTGKTSLVDRMIDLLELKHQYCKFDVGEYVSKNSEYQLRADLSDKADKCLTKNLILAFDEFQFGRTIDEKGIEVDKSPLRPMWEVIDSGVISRWSPVGSNAVALVKKLKIALSNGVVVTNGVVAHNEKIFNYIFENNYIYACDYVKCTETNFDTWYMDDHGNYYNNVSTKTYKKVQNPYFINYKSYKKLFELCPEKFNNIFDYEAFKQTTLDKNGEEIIDFLENKIIKETPLMKKEDYSQSLIFCIGNIDEAYKMTYSTNPDEDADAFHEHSLKITIAQMKSALSKRFRMEQIGRLGNTHIIYPSFNKKTYQGIIKNLLDKRKNEVKEKFGIKLTFDNTVNDIVYKEGVFPTQGTRPVLSTMSALIDSHLALIISDIALNCPEAEAIKWSFVDGNSPYFRVIAKSKKNKEYSKKYPVKLNVEKWRKSDFSELQTMVAVHEAGHAVAAIAVTKLVPKEVKSRTASVSEGLTFCKTPTIQTKKSMYNDIIVCLAGLEAEKLVLGDDTMSSGGGSDLNNATKLATSMIKTYGMGDFVHQVTVPNPMSAHSIYDNESNKKAEETSIEIIKKAQEETRKVLSDNMEFLIELSKHLSIYPNILENDLKTMASKYFNEFKEEDDYYDFKNKLDKKFKSFNKHNVVTLMNEN